EGAGASVAVVVRDVGDVGELAVGLHRVEVWERVPDAGSSGVLVHRRAVGGVVGAVRLGALLHVVTPADTGPVEEVGEVGPRVVRRRARAAQVVGRRGRGL